MKRTNPESKLSWMGKCVFALTLTLGVAGASSARPFDNSYQALEIQAVQEQIVENRWIKYQPTAQEIKTDGEPGIIYAQPGGEPGWGCPGWEGGGNTETVPLEPARIAFVTTHF